VVPAAGHGDLGFSLRGTGRTVTALRLQPLLEDLRLAGDTGEYSRIAGDLRLRREGENVTLQANAFELSRTGAAWRPTGVDALLTRKDGRLATLSVRADYLRIENLVPFAHLMPPGELRERILALQARGELFGLDIALADTGAKRLPDVSGRVRFADLGFEPFRRAPGITGLDGAIEGRGAGGVVRVATRNATMNWPLQWRELVALPRADGSVEWERFGNGVRFFVDDGRRRRSHRIRSRQRERAPARRLASG
jgi:uncharacterized protein YhdP